MESSRVFVKNLPPAISEAEFRKHFSAEGREVTDVKLIPHRRIGFVGYRSHEDAARAVKYFNKSFIRMSRVAVDLAKPVRISFPCPTHWTTTNHACKIADSASRPAAKNNADRNPIRPSLPKASVPDINPTEDANPKKRKRQAPDEADPKLQEYLEAMGHPTKKPRDKEALGGSFQSDMTPAVPSAVLEAGESDDEYEDIPARPLKTPLQTAPTHTGTLAASVEDDEPSMPAPPDEPAREAPQVPADATDDDWLRSRTSRLLDLVDPDDPEFSTQSAPPVPDAVPASEMQEQSHGGPAADADEPHEATGKGESPDDAVALVLKTSRLFLRNLSYTVTEDDIREHFGKFGNLEEVSTS